jgi:hypothetical protein
MVVSFVMTGEIWHPDLQRGIAGREIQPPKRIDEVDDSERQDNARTKNHEKFCGQGAPHCNLSR